jgi:hypothetical protein
MNTRPLHSRIRAAAVVLPALLLVLTVSLGARKSHVSAAKGAPPQSSQAGPKIWLQEPQNLPVTYVAAASGLANGATGVAQNGVAQNVVQNGMVLLEDTSANLLTNEMVRAAYLGL